MDFKCRLCGNTEYVLVCNNPWIKTCKGCSAVFMYENEFSLERELKIEYLNNYDLEGWGKIKFSELLDSGADLRAAISEPVTIHPYSDCGYDDTFVKIPFGIKIQPSHQDMYVEIFNRSSLSCKYGISLRNNVGVIDYGYRQEVIGFYRNTSKRPYTIQPGERIAQMILKQRMDVKLVTVDNVEETDRGGFGSTGKN